MFTFDLIGIQQDTIPRVYRYCFPLPQLSEPALRARAAPAPQHWAQKILKSQQKLLALYMRRRTSLFIQFQYRQVCQRSICAHCRVQIPVLLHQCSCGRYALSFTGYCASRHFSGAIVPPPPFLNTNILQHYTVTPPGTVIGKGLSRPSIYSAWGSYFPG